MTDNPYAPPPRGDHAGWHRAALASLDLETTGVDPFHDRVLSYALLGEDGVETSGLVDPGVPVPAASAAVHGITDAMVAGAPPAREAVGVVLAWVQGVIDRGVGLVVFNAAYDLTMLYAEARRWGLAQPEWHRLVVVDPFVLDWGVDRAHRGRRRLSDVSDFYGVELLAAHDATADARAARAVAIEIGWRHPAVAVGPPELMQRQRDWFAARVADWNDYATAAGRPLDDPEGWPLGVERAG